MNERGLRWSLVLLLAVEAGLGVSGSLELMPWLVAAISIAAALGVIATPVLGAIAAMATGIAIALLAAFEPNLQAAFALGGLAIAALGYELYRVRARTGALRLA
jgi:hypothetical protein